MDARPVAAVGGQIARVVGDLARIEGSRESGAEGGGHVLDRVVPRFAPDVEAIAQRCFQVRAWFLRFFARKAASTSIWSRLAMANR
jgi:hypothetical protein